MITEPHVDLLESGPDDPTRYDPALSRRLRRRAADERRRAMAIRDMASGLPGPAATSAKRHACAHELQALVFLVQSDGREHGVSTGPMEEGAR